MAKKVLIIGRFQPVHLGHLNLIKRYSKSGFHIKIAIGSSQKSFEKHNPLTFEERKDIIICALKEANIKNYKIYEVPDINKDSKYVEHVLRIVGDFDTIVTGNPSILKLFRDYISKKPWDIESFEESKGRPGGEITSGVIRELWIKKPNKKGLSNSMFKHLKTLNFSDRLKN